MSFLTDKYGSPRLSALVASYVVLFAAMGALIYHFGHSLNDAERAEEARRRALEERVERIDEKTDQILRRLEDGGTP